MTSKSACLLCTMLATLHIHHCCSHGCEIVTITTSSAVKIPVLPDLKRINTQRGRALLWIRAPDVAHLTKIPFDPAQSRVPSWSWMAYEGATSFLILQFGDIDWTTDIEFRSPFSTSGTSRASRARMSSSRNGHRTELRVVARSFDMPVASYASKSSGIVWDHPTATHDQLRYVVIGRLASESGTPAQKHWVLIVRELRAGLYERVGAGFLPKDRISQDFREIDSSVC